MRKRSLIARVRGALPKDDKDKGPTVLKSDDLRALLEALKGRGQKRKKKK